MGTLKRLSFLKRPKVFIPLIVVILIIAVVVLAIRNLNAPAVGTISQTPPTKAEQADPYANPGLYKGKYISFSYPAHYRRVGAQLTSGYLEVAGFFATDQSSKQISVGVLKENISDDSGIKLRRQETDKYVEEPRTKTGVIIFSSTVNGSERTAFVTHGDEVATLSITAPPGWDLTADMETMLNSLKWLQ